VRTGLSALLLAWIVTVSLPGSSSGDRFGTLGGTAQPVQTAWYAIAISVLIVCTFLLPFVWPTMGLYQVQAAVSLRLERSGVPSTINWLDLYASSDPVPSGPFAFPPAPVKASDKVWWRHFSPANRYRRALATLRRAGDPEGGHVRVTSAQVENRASIIFDHTTYLTNTEQVITPIVDHVSAFTSITPTRMREGYVQRLTDAWTIRQWRVGWLVTMRVSFLGQAWAIFFIAYYRSGTWIYSLPLISVLVFWYAAVVLRVWRKWDRADQRSFLRNRPFPHLATLWLFLVVIMLPGVLLSTIVALLPQAASSGDELFYAVFTWVVFLLSCSLRKWRPVISATERIKQCAGPQLGHQADR
jgi:hypothetical protein